MGPARSRFAVDRLAGRGETTVSTRLQGEVELAAVAARLRIPAVASLAVDWTLRAVPGGAVAADGVLAAAVVQVCVVTLEPFEAAVGERFHVRFVPEDEARGEGKLDDDGFDDDPDAPDTIPYDGRAIDLGEAAVEQLALALDPFPRKPGAEFAEGAPFADNAGGPATSPFATLASRRAGPREDRS